MDICISKNVLGTEKHLVARKDGSYVWVAKKPEKCFSVGFECSESKIVASLLGKEISENPGEKYLKAMNFLGVDSDIPWHYSVPEKVFKKFIQKITDDARMIFEDPQYCYHRNYLDKAQRSIQKLSRTRIDEEEFNRLMGDNSVLNKGAIGSFFPNEGYSTKPVYDFVGTNTGRLTIKSGPQILTLKKEHRSILKSRFPGGRIVQLDYVSLEPRVALSLLGINPPKDIYGFVSDNILNKETGRESAKLLTIALLYGMGKKRVKEILGGTLLNPEETMKKLDDFFGAKIIREELKKQAKSGFIQNYYGRNIRVRSDSEHVLYNNLIQSTAVDVALQGFSKIINKIYDEEKRMRPIFVLHDALLIDCPPDEVKFLDDLCVLGSAAKDLDAYFYLKKELVN